MIDKTMIVAQKPFEIVHDFSNYAKENLKSALNSDHHILPFIADVLSTEVHVHVYTEIVTLVIFGDLLVEQSL